MYYDFESGILYSRKDLEKLFQDLKSSGDTEAESFGEYLRTISPSENGCVETLYNVSGSDAIGKTYGAWIETNHCFDECIGFYRDGSEMGIIPDEIESFRILEIYMDKYHNVAFIRFDAERI